MKKSKIVKVTLCAVAAGSLISSTFALASYSITDNANPFGIAIATNDYKTINFHVPDSSDADCLAFETTSKYISYGDAINSQGVPDVSQFYSFSFQGWYSDANYTQSVDVSSLVSGDLDLYAKFQRNNVLMTDEGEFFLSSNSTQTVNSYGVYKIATQTWGVTPSKVEADRVNLITESGKYIFTYANSSWTMKRVVKINLSNAYTDYSDSWTDNYCVIKPWLFDSQSGASDKWGDTITFTNRNAEISIDVGYNGIIFARLDKNNPTWDGKWQQTPNIFLNTDDMGDPARRYTSDSIKCYLWKNSGGAFCFSWGAE